MKRVLIYAALALSVGGCATQMTPEQAQQRAEERRQWEKDREIYRDAAGPPPGSHIGIGIGHGGGGSWGGAGFGIGF